ncbi:MAG: hypothetical protein PVSMB1_04830 [Gemmatimonadaceae bacterium]
MTEDNFEEFLKKRAQDYNTPPARVPRDEMWNAIQAKRARGARVVYAGGLASRGVAERRFGSPVWLGVAAAALLLVATGVGIGRWTAAPNTRENTTSKLPPPPSVADTRGQTQNVAPAEGGVPTVNMSPGGVSGGATGPRELATSQPLKNGGGDANETRVATRASPFSDSPGSAYQLTAVRHLSEAEALLTSFRARSTPDQQMDAQLGAWARQLLSNTRLLLDSPVANDPQRRPLLEDLELVLVQIVQLSPGSTSQDRELIEKSLQQDHVMTRLRTAIPAGSERGG